MQYVDRVLSAMAYDGNRFVGAWLMARATYAYTRAHDGTEIAPGEYITFSRWYSFKGALAVFWEHLFGSFVWLARP